MTVAAELVAEQAELWHRLTAHPFVAAVAEGTLPAAAFDRWIVADHGFVVGFRRFLAKLLALAPDEPARDLLASGLVALTPELALFRRAAVERGLDLSAAPGPTALGYTSYLQSSLDDGWQVALTVLYGAERAYSDAWRAVADGAAASAYTPWVDNWASDDFAAYVDALGTLLERAGGRPRHDVFGTVVRFELRFWDAVHLGDTWV